MTRRELIQYCANQSGLCHGTICQKHEDQIGIIISRVVRECKNRVKNVPLDEGTSSDIIAALDII